jgi:hypothetical protein
VDDDVDVDEDVDVDDDVDVDEASTWTRTSM